jgi:cytochrome bd-type quinol oxidase subunit 2
MLLFKWGTFGRSLLASLLMNVTSTIFGGVLIVVGFYSDPYILLAIGFVLSVVIEGGVLILMKRDGGLRNWIVSLAANSASYLIILLPILLLNS